ncbi:hypothetical protein [Kribbella sp. NPDC048915]|uniref:hypothetical protein n=1 Tax=Kribbella sp. NPDC048915 TaxID=3155148 RepID=UPI0033C59941
MPESHRLTSGRSLQITTIAERPEHLVPVDCDVAADRAVYVEPNVWVRHGFSTD